MGVLLSLAGLQLGIHSYYSRRNCGGAATGPRILAAAAAVLFLLGIGIGIARPERVSLVAAILCCLFLGTAITLKIRASRFRAPMAGNGRAPGVVRVEWRGQVSRETETYFDWAKENDAANGMRFAGGVYVILAWVAALISLA